MALKIEWLEDAERDLDVEIDYVYREFGIKAAQKAFVYAGRDALPAFWEGIWHKTALFSAVNAGMNLQNGRGSARHAAHGTPLSRHPRKQRQRKKPNILLRRFSWQ